MPSLGMFTAEGTLTAWLRPDGAQVAAGEPVAEVTTEKMIQEVVAPAAGILHRVASEGTTLAVQGLMGYILGVGETPPTSGATAAPAGPPDTLIRPAAETPGVATGGEIRATPIA